MKSLVLILLLITSQLTFGQAVDIALRFEDGIDMRTRNFGLDLNATTNIDATLGEENLPSFFPPGIEVRFDLNPFSVNAQSYKDYRAAASFPYTGNVEHRLIWQYSSGAPGMTIYYNLPTGVQIRFTDAFGIPGFVLFDSGILSGTGSYLVPNATSYTSAKLFVTYNSVLPVELVFLNAAVNDKNVTLNWQTATEINNYGFDIEKKFGISPWNKIGFIHGNGNSNSPKNYSYTDQDISLSGQYYYRLKQIDSDGTFEYSSTIEIDVSSPAKYKLKQNFPNPFNPTTTISFSVAKKSNIRLIVYNQIGQIVDEILNSVMEAGNYNFTWTAENLSSGIYYYEIQSKDFRSVKKMTLIK